MNTPSMARIGSRIRDRYSVVFYAGLTLGAGVLFSACAHGTREARRENCVLSASDSAYLAGGPVYLDCAVDQAARRLGRETPVDFTPGSLPSPGRVECYYAEVEFVAGTDGVPEARTISLARTNEAAFGQAILRSVASWRYRPAEKDGAPVRQIIRERKVAAAAVTVSRGGSGAPPPPPNCR